MTTRAIIQSRIDAASANNCGLVTIEPMHIRLDQPLVIGHNRSITLQGAGPATILEADYDDRPAIDMSGSTLGNLEIHRTIQDMVITRANNRRSNPLACGIQATDQARLTLAGLVFLQHPWGVRAIGGTEWRLSNCTFTFGCTNAIRFDKTINVYATRLILEHNGIGIEATGNAHSIHLSQCQLVNGSGYDYGVIFDGGDANSISQCVMEGARFNHVYFAGSCKDSLVANSWFGSAAKRVGQIGGGSGILADPNSERLTIANNRFGGQCGPAISLDRVRNVLIQANRFEDNCLDGGVSHIDIFESRNVTVANNSFEECPAMSALRFQTAGAGGGVRNRDILISANDFALLHAADGSGVRRAVVGLNAVDRLVSSGNMLGVTPWT